MANRMLTVLLLAGAATVAHAHAHLVESTPADKSRVPAPVAIELKFSQAVQVTALTVQRGKEAAKLLALPPKASASLSVPLPKLDAGEYVVAWRVASNDGHIMSGKFAFTVDPAARPAVAGDAHMGHAQRVGGVKQDEKEATHKH